MTDNQSINKLEQVLENFKLMINEIRATEANTSLIQNIKVNSYDSMMPLNQLSNIKSISTNLLIITPFDSSNTNDILKALSQSSLDLNCIKENDTIKVIVPPLTEERRIVLVKKIDDLKGEFNIKSRNIRQNSMKLIKKNKDFSNDERHVEMEKFDKLFFDIKSKISKLANQKKDSLMKL